MNGYAANSLRVFLIVGVCVAFAGCPSPFQLGDDLPGEGPRLGSQSISQEQIARGDFSLRQLRIEGRRIFSTPFNKADGYGDGPFDAGEFENTMGGRATLQGNGTFLRVNGLDAQSCAECHSLLSSTRIPPTFALGGAGGSVTNAMFMPTAIALGDGQGTAPFDGRFINPPFVFGIGAVELLAKEMTRDLQALMASARNAPGQDVALLTKGVSFGTIRFENGVLDTSAVEGIDADLVVRPFGRKGEFETVRSFDVGAMAFHFGMQAVEFIGQDIDGDNDGVANEVEVGEISSIGIFVTNLKRPRRGGLPILTARGEALFGSVGCAVCHVPTLRTSSRELTYSFPEVAQNPDANIYYRSDLSTGPAGFSRNRAGGLDVSLFADLKRHDMGAGLAESFGSALDAFFTTAKLWGVADSAPYLHDGRALTIGEAILAHGGEGQDSRDAYAALAEEDKAKLLAFLQSLRTPLLVDADLGG